MSMRGIKSCQRWDGEYHRCLIGSILSKYVGIIYLTSGSDFGGLGTKMMRRCLVRYAIDMTESKPCILIDRMYPSESGVNEEALKAFTNAIKSRTSLPVYYAPTLSEASKTRCFYIPFEKRRTEIPAKDWTYQDIPLKTNIDYKLHVLTTAHNEDYEYYVSAFKNNLSHHLSSTLRKITSNELNVSPLVKQMVSNIRMYLSINTLIEQFSKFILSGMPYQLDHQNNMEIKALYRKFLFKTASQIKKNQQLQKVNLNGLLNQFSTSANSDHTEFVEFMTASIFGFIKSELSKNINNNV